ncbi:MAG: hypothetical protein Q7S28_03155 [bacterium]|nr:hypothetical protein [bacterium]
MTFIKPNLYTDILTRVIVALVIPVIAGVVWVIIIYNQTVSLHRNVSRMETEMKSLEADNADLKDRIFTLFDTDHVRALAASRGLIQEKKPTYIESSPWVIASHY